MSLTLQNFEPTLAITGEAQKAKAEALEEAAVVQQVKSHFEQEIAAEALSNLNSIIRQTESTRKDVKAPVLDLGRKVDAIARSYVGDLKQEATRINTLLSAYLQAERVKAEQARKRAEEEERKIRMEADLKRQKAMEEAKETGKVIEKVETIEREEAHQIMDVRQNEAAASAPKSSGVNLRVDWKYEVTDIDALRKARPELTHLEPNKGAINAMVKSGVREIPGVRIYSETTTVTK